MNKHKGSSFDEFLEEEGILEECEQEAEKRVRQFVESAEQENS